VGYPDCSKSNAGAILPLAPKLPGVSGYDANEAALRAILAEWTSGHTYATRIANIRGPGSTSRLNETYYLKNRGSGQTLFDDNAVDSLFGGDGRDWYFARLGSDTITNLANNETVDSLS
jgi:Ca2+-binding RTX toxin-like protein